jgi:ArsR family transcriptional regulator, arsenate/arsenite/antimonite-responsive transcriptional repressor
MSDLFDVLADETRRKIVATLNAATEPADDGLVELSVGELVESVGATQPTVSKHLKVLRDAGIVTVREEGQHRYYRLNPRALSPVSDWLSELTGNPSIPEKAMELQRPYVDLWSVGYRVGGMVADTRDAIVGLWGRRF